MNPVVAGDALYGVNGQFVEFHVEPIVGGFGQRGSVELGVAGLVDPTITCRHFEQSEAQQALKSDVDVFQRDTEGAGDPAGIGFEALDLKKLQDGVVNPNGEQLKRVEIEMNAGNIVGGFFALGFSLSVLCVRFDGFFAESQSLANGLQIARRKAAFAPEDLGESGVVDAELFSKRAQGESRIAARGGAEAFAQNGRDVLPSRAEVGGECGLHERSLEKNGAKGNGFVPKAGQMVAPLFQRHGGLGYCSW